MIEIGRVCIKTAGRDAKREAVVVDILDEKFVLIDGNVRRRKCNILHLEPTEILLKIKKNTITEGVLSTMSDAGLKVEKKVKKISKKKDITSYGTKAKETKGSKSRAKELKGTETSKRKKVKSLKK